MNRKSGKREISEIRRYLSMLKSNKKRDIDHILHVISGAKIALHELQECACSLTAINKKYTQDLGQRDWKKTSEM